jgi:cytochrome c peroxidase
LPAQDAQRPSSYAPVDIHETFSAIMTRMTAAKAEIMRRQLALLDQRYDLSDRPAQGAAMSKGKPLQEGVRVKLSGGATWDQLAKLSPEQIKERDLYPAGFQPLPHPNHAEGGGIHAQL